MAGQEMVIFTRTFDLLSWLLPATNNFPRAHRFTVTNRLLDVAFDLSESLFKNLGDLKSVFMIGCL
ncbi:MAG: hypothetical protein ACK2U6_14345 [Candidatus Promineifilaceae bacterium]